MHACTLVRRSGTAEEEAECLFKAKAKKKGDARRVLRKDNVCDLFDCFAIPVLFSVVLCNDAHTDEPRL